MSSKTVDLINENEQLANKITVLKAENNLLKESEKQLAKRNIAHQKVIQMLIEKLRETDKMLEIAYDTGIVEEASQLIEKNLLTHASSTLVSISILRSLGLTFLGPRD